MQLFASFPWCEELENVQSVPNLRLSVQPFAVNVAKLLDQVFCFSL